MVQVRLVLAPGQGEALTGTLHACNEAANEVSRLAREKGVLRTVPLHRLAYGVAKGVTGGAQAANITVRKVAAAYSSHTANLRNGRYGAKGTKRRAKAEAKVLRFRPDAAQPFDDRMLSWRHANQEVSIWVSDTGQGKPGRIKVAYTGRPADLVALAARRKGESDLVHRKGVFYLLATLEEPEPEVTTPGGFLGVDLGIVNIATVATDQGDLVQDHSGGVVQARREKNAALRARLQAKGTKSAKRLLKKRSGKEARFAKDTNHCVSKKIVAEAERTGRGIAIEDLTGIRERVRHRKPQRATFHSWAFAQLGHFLAYKAAAAGVALVQVDPAYTSQTCSGCGHTEKKNRSTQADFACRSCGLSLGADHNAAINIARRGRDTWGAVNRPHAA